jgi:hypothetical protein
VFANGNRTVNIARLRELLRVPPVVEAAEKEAAIDHQHQLPCTCLRCGGRMIMIETFAVGMQQLLRQSHPPRVLVIPWRWHSTDDHPPQPVQRCPSHLSSERYCLATRSRQLNIFLAQPPDKSP